MATPLRLVTEQFPSLEDEIAGLFERDLVFRELCEDYAACAEAATRLDPGAASTAAYRQEYAALQLRLETELLRHVHEAQRPDGR
jgi:hypothetical protein